jgi:hypothetical protein
MSERITISWDELNTRKVEQRLGQMQAVHRNREYAALTDVAPEQQKNARGSIWYNTLFYMSLFGLVGGLLAWTCGTLLHFRPSAKFEAMELMKDVNEVRKAEHVGKITADEANAAIAEVARNGRNNPYFVVSNDTSLSDAQRQAKLKQVGAHDAWKEFIGNVLSFGVSGLIIAMCLSMAEPVISRNVPSMVINGSVGATLGLLGGVAVAVFVERLYQALLKSDMSITGGRQIMARTVTWAVVGLTLALAPGVVMRSWKMLLIGAAGGVIGGAVGGALYDGIYRLTGVESLSRLFGLMAIGGVTGLAAGVIESAAKSGWVRVVQGLIAGKQFILYRNPTFVGSSPDNHIYLFKDVKVGRRHAAIHLVQGGFELEDLPLGEPTTVNGKAVTRARLRSGDRIQIGSTILLFQEKQPSA